MPMPPTGEETRVLTEPELQDIFFREARYYPSLTSAYGIRALGEFAHANDPRDLYTAWSEKVLASGRYTLNSLVAEEEEGG